MEDILKKAPHRLVGGHIEVVFGAVEQQPCYRCGLPTAQTDENGDEQAGCRAKQPAENLPMDKAEGKECDSKAGQKDPQDHRNRHNIAFQQNVQPGCDMFFYAAEEFARQKLVKLRQYGGQRCKYQRRDQGAKVKGQFRYFRHRVKPHICVPLCGGNGKTSIQL